MVLSRQRNADNSERFRVVKKISSSELTLVDRMYRMIFADVQIGQTCVLTHGAGKYTKLDEYHAWQDAGYDARTVTINPGSEVDHICE